MSTGDSSSWRKQVGAEKFNYSPELSIMQLEERKKQQATCYIGCVLKASIKAYCQQQESNNYKCCSVGRLSDRAPLFEILQKPCQHSANFDVLAFLFLLLLFLLFLAGACVGR